VSDLLVAQQQPTEGKIVYFVTRPALSQSPRERVNGQIRAGAPRARDAWRKFTEIYGNPRGGAARAPCIDFLAAKGEVQP
jgi:hypothetical protein